ncbi:MAG: protein kinase [Terriglobia bacterium]
MTEIDAHLAASLARRFRLVRRLGQGGMGAVFLAEQIAVGNRPVALKVLNRKLLDDPDFLLRFQNEAASTGRIHHPNVVTIYESGQADDGTPYIAIEFLKGESLRQAITHQGAPVNQKRKGIEQAGSVSGRPPCLCGEPYDGEFLSIEKDVRLTDSVARHSPLVTCHCPWSCS